MWGIILLSTLLISFICWLFRRKPNFPPGPMNLPIIGSIHITRGTPHLACIELSKKYGPILGLKFGSQRTVLLHGAKLIRDTFNDANFCGRKPTEATSLLLGDEFGILQSSGDVWVEQRRFSVRTLRDFGFGRASMEEMILEEAQELCDWLKRQNGAPVELSRRLSLAVVNSLWRILTGERYDHDDQALLDILEKMERTQKLLLDFTAPLKVALLLFYPTIAKFFSNYTGWNNIVATAQPRIDLYDRIIREHGETLQEENPRDFVDMYLYEVNRTTDKQSSFHPSKGRNSLRSVMSDLFVAGSDTTSITLYWTILYLLNNPRVQNKIHAELDSILGRERRPSLADRKNLPYTECLIMEVLRCSSILPIGFSHCCVEDSNIGGYEIPKGTLIHANIYQVHHDPEVWGDPEVFRPERFLNPDGTCMQRHESLMPFSVGRRVCMGESLARDSLFLFTTMLLQNFNMSVPEGSEMPTLAPRTEQVTLHPQRYEVCMESRN